MVIVTVHIIVVIMQGVMIKDKLIWCWGPDGSILFVFRIYQTRFLKRWKLERVRHFYTSDFTDVQEVAEDFIRRYEER